MTLAWFDCSSGASGDMFLGALVDAGAPLEGMQAAIDAVGVEAVTLRSRDVTRAGLAATQVEVRTPRSDVVRTWANIRGLLEQAQLPEPVRGRALDVFARLARAEAKAHRVRPERVHFHEVGALDAIADVVGASAGLDALGVTHAEASAVALGSGMVRSEHGLLPVPGPAVLSLLGEVDAPVHSGPVAREMCTPTGAALLASTVSRWGGLPAMRVGRCGTGAGGRDNDELPNVLRVVLGEPADDRSARVGDALVIEANVDDLDPRVWPRVLTSLLEAGASDAWLTPMLMKKGRPAHTLSVLTSSEHADAVRRTVFRESSTIGLREHRVAKHALERQTRTVSVDGIDVRVKVALLDGEVTNVSPEYDDVAAAAARLGRSVKAVLAATVAAAHLPPGRPG
ncbi:MAG: pyridinium-3,5-bisthiocarboxylic acid mononucleotide nickel chelatase [Actinomycetota bacterium]|nr:pyridinium-3,5-bisthiocarboxylic acid mononucleotide nickel chelatase [Actinomycetota bacterium]